VRPAADSKFSNRHVTFESNSNGDVRFEFESNLEASQVPFTATFAVKILQLSVHENSGQLAEQRGAQLKVAGTTAFVSLLVILIQAFEL